MTSRRYLEGGEPQPQHPLCPAPRTSAPRAKNPLRSGTSTEYQPGLSIFTKLIHQAAHNLGFFMFFEGRGPQSLRSSLHLGFGDHSVKCGHTHSFLKCEMRLDQVMGS